VSAVTWYRKDADRWLGRTQTHLLCVQRTTDRTRWSWKITVLGGGVVHAAGIARSDSDAKSDAEKALNKHQAAEATP